VAPTKVTIRDLVEDAPTKPGCYKWVNKKKKIIYVGKAKNLKKRLKWYLDEAKLDAKNKLLMREAKTVEYIVTDSETEALILECTLIKKYEPKYNVDLKDGKKYPYLKLDATEKYERLCTTRRVVDDRSSYYGPYPDVGSMKKVFKLAQKLFQLRTCKGDVSKKRPCLKYHISRCVGPCTGKITEKEYNTLVAQTRLVFSGKTTKLVRELKREMKSHSKKTDFEQAAKTRDLIYAIERVSENQKVEFTDKRDVDVIGHATRGESSGVSVIVIRDGKLISHFFYRLKGELRGNIEESLSAFIKQYYRPLADTPTEVIVSSSISDSKSISRWLNAKKQRKVRITTPSRGIKKELIKLAKKNAKHAVELEEAKRTLGKPTEELERSLKLPQPPEGIEGFDVSNLGGDFAVGGMVVFTNGEIDKSQYRRFKIKTVQGSDDVAMIREVLRRRRKRKDWPKADLILIDGGRGQVNAAEKELEGWGVSIISLAKKEEEVYTKDRKTPLKLPKDSQALKLLMYVRDEAHRFALNYHRHLRKTGFRS